ncbi:hypothetical protein FOA43_002060 [Brettanomyces nanus]|uniref:Uncharacterized protein n=1 Tax=Eeniella nana TaxID=13502 RepID=A0A875RUM2_EENNA|nr:uncharacterized protein FOA43_002060 [Brettanomyces nanus]QPG74727.1 hypothetical protein FOA43_002060 [Brettanomyces nanus]
MNQGWLIVALTSLTTICGCLVIYTDVVYKTLFPARYKKKPFHIANNTPFLVCSLSLSAGCLTFVSLNKLLPTGIKYLKEVPSLRRDPRLLKGSAFACYVAGIACCSLLNVLVHLFTSESIVHCVHEIDSPEGHHHQYIHESPHDEHDDHHVHEDDECFHSDDIETCSGNHIDINKLQVQRKAETPRTTEGSTSSSTNPDLTILAGPEAEPELVENCNETTPLTTVYKPVAMGRGISVVDLSLKALKGEKMEGDCYGDMACCCEEIACKHHLHQHPNGKGLHFCIFPSTENQIFFEQDNGEMMRDNAELVKKFPELEIRSPLIKDTVNYQTTTNSSMRRASTNEHHEHHHHHIKTPLARLLSIGVQTTLAITMHKFPEGFIMYSTSQADSRLGWTIFLSMFIHNFVEGFTMTLPIYLALDSRWKALLISGSLGGMAQPIGALIGYFLFRHNGVDVDDPFSMMLIGCLMALTSGFLTYIGLQMLTSAVSFGGRQETVLKWTISGVCLIFFTNVLM